MKFVVDSGERDSPKNCDGHPIPLWGERVSLKSRNKTHESPLTLKIPLHPSLFHTPLKSRTALRPVEASSAPLWSRLFATSIGVQMTPETISAVSPDSRYTGACCIQLGLCPVILALWYADGNNVGPQKSFAAMPDRDTKTRSGRFRFFG
jgi:hypothetical protein